MLKLDLANILITLVNLIVLYLCLKKFMIGPVLNVMKKREDMIQGQFQQAAETQKDAEELKEQYKQKIEQAGEESTRIVEQAKQRASEHYEAKVTDAEAQAKFLVAKAQEQIQLEREKALAEMESQIAGLAMEAAGKIVTGDASAEKNQSMYDEFLAKAGDANDTDGK